MPEKEDSNTPLIDAVRLCVRDLISGVAEDETRERLMQMGYNEDGAEDLTNLATCGCHAVIQEDNGASPDEAREPFEGCGLELKIIDAIIAVARKEIEASEESDFGRALLVNVTALLEELDLDPDTADTPMGQMAKLYDLYVDMAEENFSNGEIATTIVDERGLPRMVVDDLLGQIATAESYVNRLRDGEALQATDLKLDEKPPYFPVLLAHIIEQQLG